jgi:hypothetical protein
MVGRCGDGSPGPREWSLGSVSCHKSAWGTLGPKSRRPAGSGQGHPACPSVDRPPSGTANHGLESPFMTKGLCAGHVARKEPTWRAEGDAARRTRGRQRWHGARAGPARGRGADRIGGEAERPGLAGSCRGADRVGGGGRAPGHPPSRAAARTGSATGRVPGDGRQPGHFLAATRCGRAVAWHGHCETSRAIAMQRRGRIRGWFRGWRIHRMSATGRSVGRRRTWERTVDGYDTDDGRYLADR